MWPEFGLLASADREIWDFAQARNFVIVSTDSDFYERHNHWTASQSRVATALDRH